MLSGRTILRAYPRPAGVVNSALEPHDPPDRRAYPYEYRAEEVLDTLTRLGRADLADLADACYVSRASDGRVRLHRPIDLPALGGATGARRDARVGSACLEPLLGGSGGEARRASCLAPPASTSNS
jgi:hypothetical protein